MAAVRLLLLLALSVSLFPLAPAAPPEPPATPESSVTPSPPGATPPPEPTASPPDPTATTAPAPTASATASPSDPSATMAPAPTASATASPPDPSVRLNEFRANPAAGGQEFIELHNAGGAALDLGGWRLDDAEGGGAPHAIPAGTTLPPGGFWVWMIPGAYLNNAGDDVRLFDPAGRLADSAAFANAPLDRSTSRLPDGAGPWADGTPPTPGQPNQAPPPSTPTPGPGPAPRVALNEYLAAPPAGEREFVEVISLEPAPVDLSGWKVRDASGATRGLTATAQPGQPHALLIASGFLNNGAETITLLDPLGRPTDAISYTAAVAGRSASRLPDGAGGWTDGTPPTPGQPNQAAPPPPDAAVRLNEALPRPDAGGQEFVEIINLGAEPVGLRGWKVRDLSGATRGFTLTELLPGQFHALRLGSGLLNDAGDAIELLDSRGGVVDQMSYGAARPGRSLSRLPDGTGDWLDGAPPTPDDANRPPPVARVALNEFLAQPAPGGQEFVEIVNLGAEPVDLRGWRISDAASHTQAFTVSAVPPGGFHALRFGGGLLNNGADSISLLDPEGAVIETVAYTGTSLNRSASRLPDGTGAWTDGAPPTPDAANQSPPPLPPPAAVRLRLNELGPNPAAGGREFAEVINLGAGGVDLRGWKLRDLSGATRGFTLTELAPGGIHALWFGSGFLNDGREVVELLDPAGVPVDSAEYDGVAENFSASRLPDGAGEWQRDTPATPGAANQPPPPLPEGLALNEFLPHPAKGESEWVELAYLGDAPLNLSGWQLDDGPGGGSPTRLGAGTAIAPGEFLVVYLRTNILNDRGDQIRLLAPNGSVVDHFDFGKTKDQSTWSRLPDAIGPWDGHTPPTPGAPNQPPPEPEPGAPAEPGTGAAPGSVLLTEIAYDIPGDRDENRNEWVEILNVTTGTLRLSGWALRDNKAESRLPAFELAAGETAVLAVSAELTSFFPAFTGTLVLAPGAKLGNGLGNAGDRLELIDGAGRTIDQLSWGDNAELLNPAAPDAATGQSLRRSPARQDTDSAADWQTGEPPNPGVADDASAAAAPPEAGPPTSAPPGAVLIAEVLYDPAESPEQPREWLSLINAQPVSVTLRGWTISDSRASDELPPVTLRPSERLLVAASAAVTETLSFSGTVAVIADGLIGGGLNNGGDALVLRDGDGGLVDALSWGGDTSILNPPAPASGPGRTLRRTPPTGDTDSAADWQAGEPASPAASQPPAEVLSSTVLLSEILAAPAAIDWDGDGKAGGEDEWIELANRGAEPADLGGWRLDDQADGGSKPFAIPAGTVIQPGGFLVLYRRQTRLSLNNSGAEQVRLLAPGGGLADQMDYRATRKDRSWAWRPLAGDAGGWAADCLPTPGAANGPCGAAAGAKTVPINQLYALPLKSAAVISGVVTVAPGALRKNALYVQDATGGIQVLLASKPAWPKLAPGQRVTLRGTLATYRGERELKVNDPADLALGAAGRPPRPLSVTGAGVSAGRVGQLVAVRGSYLKAAGRDILLRAGDGSIIQVHPPASMKKPRLRKGDALVAVGIVGLSNGKLRLQLRGPADLGLGNPARLPITGGGGGGAAGLGWLIALCLAAGLALRLRAGGRRLLAHQLPSQMGQLGQDEALHGQADRAGRAGHAEDQRAAGDAADRSREHGPGADLLE